MYNMDIGDVITFTHKEHHKGPEEEIVIKTGAEFHRQLYDRSKPRECIGDEEWALAKEKWADFAYKYCYAEKTTVQYHNQCKKTYVSSRSDHIQTFVDKYCFDRWV